MRIERVGPEEVEDFLRFRAAGLSGDPAAFRTTPADDDATGVDAWRQRLARDYVTAVRGEDGDWLGVGGVTRLDGERLSHKGLLWGMYTIPSARGTGVADRIMAALIDHSRGRVRQLQLTVMADNARARAFYERHLFSTYAIEPASVRRQGDYADEAYMWRLL